MSRYLLSCSCGKNVPVEVGQAGGKVVCTACGSALDVPTLRMLRHLPRDAAEVEHVPSTWSARHGVATAGLLLAAILAATAVASRYREPAVPEFDPVMSMQQVDEFIKTMTPTQGFQRWVSYYRPQAEKGFGVIENPHKPAIEQYIARQRFFQKTLLLVAAASAAVALAAALWPRSTQRLAATR